MAAKFLQTLTDENVDLQKQIGCMTGIFQLFDRHHTLIARRSHKRLPPGNSLFNNGREIEEANNIYHRQTATERNSSEKQRVSTESSRASFSSSSCSSSFSSIDCTKPSQVDPSSFDRIIFPEKPSQDPAMMSKRLSLDLRDVVKDSMYRESHKLSSLKTTNKEEEVGRLIKLKDSPRPLPISSSMINGNQNPDVDLKESFRVLAKLQEAPWYFNEAGEKKDGSFLSVPKDAPRFSYDGRELKSRAFFESRENLNSTQKLKELPRLSLDSREGTLRESNSHAKSNLLMAGNLGNQEPGVVAKLMGLEALPNSISSVDSSMRLMKPSVDECHDPSIKSTKTSHPNVQVQMPSSMKSSRKDFKSPDSVIKPIANSKVPIEPAPWSQPKPAFGNRKSIARELNSFTSVYSEIEKRLKELEFKQSGKDLRALKQILEAMQAKGRLVLKKEGEEEEAVFKHNNIKRNPRLINQQNPQRIREAISSRTFESPIVIMKPAKSVENKPKGGEFADKRKGLTNMQQVKHQTPKSSRRDPSVSSTDRKPHGKNLRSTQNSNRSKENVTDPINGSGSVSPRLLQKKVELGKGKRIPTSSSDSSKPKRQLHRQRTESTSPSGKLRLKTLNLQLSDDQMSEISSGTRNTSYQGDEVSIESDVEVTSAAQSAKIIGIQCSSRKAANIYDVSYSSQKNSNRRMREAGLKAELDTAAPEQPSPVSVLDGSVYKDDSPSPVKQIRNNSKGNEGRNYSGNFNNEDRDPVYHPVSTSSVPMITSEINRNKLQNINYLVQKLRRLNSNHDESSTDYIASLCENSNPDHRYVSEILLASGILLRDLTTFQLHSSGHPINPELFFVLEQTKSSNSLLKKDESKSDREKVQRKLIFDTLNEILIRKLSLVGPTSSPWVKPRAIVMKNLNAQMLLKELCIEIEELRGEKGQRFAQDEDDGFMKMLREDVMNDRSESWMEFNGEISGMVLEIERLVFKDLVDEIVIGEAASCRTKNSRWCRQLFF